MSCILFNLKTDYALWLSTSQTNFQPNFLFYLIPVRSMRDRLKAFEFHYSIVEKLKKVLPSRELNNVVEYIIPWISTGMWFLPICENCVTYLSEASPWTRNCGLIACVGLHYWDYRRSNFPDRRWSNEQWRKGNCRWTQEMILVADWKVIVKKNLWRER